MLGLFFFSVISLASPGIRSGKVRTKNHRRLVHIKLEVAKMASNGIMIAGAEIKHLYSGEWPSGKATDFECVALPDNGRSMLVQRPQRYVNMVTWIFAPEWLTFEEACYLSGYDRGTMRQVLEVDGVDLDDAGRIEKRSLWEWLEVSVELAHFEQGVQDAHAYA